MSHPDPTKDYHDDYPLPNTEGKGMSKTANKEGTQMGQQGSFTPGPWRKSFDTLNECHRVVTDRQDEQFPNVLATISEPEEGTSLANARLIACAPELLEVCKEVANLSPQDTLTVAAVNHYRRIAIEAIAHAEGRAQG